MNLLQGAIHISFLSDTALATSDRHFFLKELLMYGITCLVIRQLISRPLQDSSVVLYLSTFLITWYNHLNSELILFIRSI